MAPKRKAAATTSETTASKKSKVSEPAAPSASTSKPRAASKAAKAAKEPIQMAKTSTSTTKASSGKDKGKAKGKGKSSKKQASSSSSETDDESDDGDSSDSDVIIEEPKSKTKAKKASASTSTSSTSTKTTSKSKETMKTTTTKKSKSHAEKRSPPTPSESGSAAANGSKKPAAKKSQAKPAAKARAIAKPASTFEDELRGWFSKFADEDDEDKIGMEGAMRLFDEMGMSLESVHPLILAWDVKAKPGTFGSYSFSDFRENLRPHKITSVARLKTYLLELESSLYPAQTSRASSSTSPAANLSSSLDALFKGFYSFLFPFAKEEGTKGLSSEMAIAVLETALRPRYSLGGDFVEYAKAQGEKFKTISSDVWTQLLSFCQTVEPDLTGFSEDDAWPSTIDAFVEWKKERDAASKSA
ncbi:hypothetical protein JCM10212_006546 [Sporobolomyces blumeae]